MIDEKTLELWGRTEPYECIPDLISEIRKLRKVAEAAKYVDRSHWSSPEKGYACLGCDMNQGAIEAHDSWCGIQKLHEALAEWECP